MTPTPLHAQGGAQSGRRQLSFHTVGRWLKRRSLPLAMACLLPAAPALAADNVLALAGGDVARHSNYALAGGIASLSGDLNGSGFLARAWGEYLEYHYRSNGTDIKARAEGVQAAVGYRFAHADGGDTTIYLGAIWRDTHLPNGVTSSVQGNRTNALVSLEHRQQIGIGRFEGIATLGGPEREYWSRFRWMAPVGGQFTVGPEFIFQGSHLYAQQRAGLAVGYNLGKGFNAGASVGYVHDRDMSSGAYGGLVLTKSF